MDKEAIRPCEAMTEDEKKRDALIPFPEWKDSLEVRAAQYASRVNLWVIAGILAGFALLVLSEPHGES